MLYLLDADTLITGDRNAYPVSRFPIFWDWVRYQGEIGNVKIPLEQFEEVVVGRGQLVDWLLDDETRHALVLPEEANPDLVAATTLNGYGALDEQGIELVGRDPFLIAYARADLGQRTVVTFENSKPSLRGAKSKVPDVCARFGVPCCTLFDMVKSLDFTTNWSR